MPFTISRKDASGGGARTAPDDPNPDLSPDSGTPLSPVGLDSGGSGESDTDDELGPPVRMSGDGMDEGMTPAGDGNGGHRLLRNIQHFLDARDRDQRFPQLGECPADFSDGPDEHLRIGNERDQGAQGHRSFGCAPRADQHDRRELDEA